MKKVAKIPFLLTFFVLFPSIHAMDPQPDAQNSAYAGTVARTQSINDTQLQQYVADRNTGGIATFLAARFSDSPQAQSASVVLQNLARKHQQDFDTFLTKLHTLATVPSYRARIELDIDTITLYTRYGLWNRTISPSAMTREQALEMLNNALDTHNIPAIISIYTRHLKDSDLHDEYFALGLITSFLETNINNGNNTITTALSQFIHLFTNSDHDEEIRSTKTQYYERFNNLIQQQMARRNQNPHEETSDTIAQEIQQAIQTSDIEQLIHLNDFVCNGTESKVMILRSLFNLALQTQNIALLQSLQEQFADHNIATIDQINHIITQFSPAPTQPTATTLAVAPNTNSIEPVTHEETIANSSSDSGQSNIQYNNSQLSLLGRAWSSIKNKTRNLFTGTTLTSTTAALTRLPQQTWTFMKTNKGKVVGGSALLAAAGALSYYLWKR